MRRALVSIVGALAVLGLFAGPVAAQSPDATDPEAVDAPVVFWDGTWNTVAINTEIATFILENGYDLETAQVGVSVSIMQQALLSGEIDVNPEMWCINRTSYCEENFGEGAPLDKLSPIFEDAEQGFYVPEYVVKGEDAPAPDLTSITQLDQQTYAELFGGQIIGGVTGYAITATNRVKLSAYGLDEMYDIQTVGAQAAVDASIVGAIQQQDPLVFYSYTPRWIHGRYDLVKLQEPEFTQACKAAQTQAEEGGAPYDNVPEAAGCAYQTTDIHPGVRADLKERAPEAYELMDKMDVGHELIAQAAANLKTEGLTPQQAAVKYLQDNEDRWTQWVPEDVAQKVKAALEGTGESDDAGIVGALTAFPVSVASSVEDGVNSFVKQWLPDNLGFLFNAISDGLGFVITGVQDFMLMLPWPVVVIAFAALAWWLKDWKLALGVSLGFIALGLLGVWEDSMRTLALILFATVISVGIGVPLGIASARNDRVDDAVRPALDFMQTMPSFVYLVPVVILFAIGAVPALVATVIYATPPVVRLTSHGIRQVPTETVEAAEAFGSTSRDTLRKVQLPLALPTIMAGVNQTIMLALAMVVIASLVGAPGLGQPVLTGLQNLNVGLAFTGGLGIVILAMIIDRLTQAAGRDVDTGEGESA